MRFSKYNVRGSILSDRADEIITKSISVDIADSAYCRAQATTGGFPIDSKPIVAIQISQMILAGKGGSDSGFEGFN